jgi:plastocyanin
MNKMIIGLLVIVLGGVAGWYFLKGTPAKTTIPTYTTNETTPSMSDTYTSTGAAMEGQAPATSSKVAIVYSDTGFSPAKVTVKKGTTVSFTNQSSGEMWVASDVHPTHQLLPSFDAKKGMAKGSTYEYTFTKVGTWTFHDHIQETYVGSVVVTE